MHVWRPKIASADRFVAEAPDLDVTGSEPWRGAGSLRCVLVRGGEYARRNSQADLLREWIDGGG